MTGSAYYTRQQWLTDEHIAHSYMLQADGSRVDAVRNLDEGTPPKTPGYDPTSYEAYTMPVSIVGDQWMIGRGGVTGVTLDPPGGG